MARNRTFLPRGMSGGLDSVARTGHLHDEGMLLRVVKRPGSPADEELALALELASPGYALMLVCGDVV
jgi:hypothetical protein